MGHDYFFDLEEKHKAWIGTKNAEPLFWEDKGEEKTDESTESVMSLGVREDSNKELSNTISVSAIKSAIETGRFDDCIILTNQVDSGEESTKSRGQAVLGRQQWPPTPWLTERHGYDPT